MNDFAVFNVFNVIRSFISCCHPSFSDACGCSVVVFMLSWKMMTVNMVLSTFSVRKISSVSLAAVSNPLFYTIADYIMESLLHLWLCFVHSYLNMMKYKVKLIKHNFKCLNTFNSPPDPVFVIQSHCH